MRPPDRDTPSLLPPGRRWGRGARTVLPYLNQALQSRLRETAADPEEPIRNPVFPRMQVVLHWEGDRGGH